MKIIQIVESLAFGDAVANDAVAIDKYLRDKNISGGIYATNSLNIDQRYLHKIAEPISNIPKMDENDVILFHHAIYNPFCPLLDKYSCHKIMVYHNITPPHFFAGIDEGLYQATDLGLEQTKALKNSFECCIADSEFNRQDLIDMGYTCPIYVCPVLVPFRDYDQKPNSDIINRYKSDGWINILFVGRLSPQKKQQDIMRAFGIYKKFYNKKSRLFLVGSDGLQNYTNMLKAYSHQLGVTDIYITGSISFTDILAYYTIADIFLCMSEHEGFCVPLLEAMYFDVPIVAFNSTAISGTLGKTGILINTKDFILTAGWINQICSDNVLRKQIIEEQWNYLQSYSYENIISQLKEILIPFCDTLKKIDYVPNDLLINVPENVHDFEVVLPIKSSDWETAKQTIPYIFKFIKPKKVVIISSEDLKKVFVDTSYVTCLNEDELLPGLSIANVRKALRRAGGNPKVAGWYLQQFIKLGYAKITMDRYYLVWDADTLPLNDIEFFDTKSKKPYFNLKREYIKEYFNTILNLLSIDKARNESFITEHMMFDASLCTQMLEEIECNYKIQGETFWEKCINASDFRNNDRTFSEFETYGTYITHKFPETYLVRKLSTLRSGQTFLGGEPSPAVLEWAAKDFDTISFEHFDNIRIGKCSDNAMYRKMFSFAHMIRNTCKRISFCSKLRLPGYQRLYNELLPKMDFDYFFGDQTVYENQFNSTKKV